MLFLSIFPIYKKSISQLRQCRKNRPCCPAYVRADTSFIIFQKPERQRKGKNPVTGFACESERYTFAGRKKAFCQKKKPVSRKSRKRAVFVICRYVFQNRPRRII